MKMLKTREYYQQKVIEAVKALDAAATKLKAAGGEIYDEIDYLNKECEQVTCTTEDQDTLHTMSDHLYKLTMVYYELQDQIESLKRWYL